MKSTVTFKHLVLLFLITSFGTTYGQEIQQNFINYQGVARDADGELMTDTEITLDIDLLFGAPDVAPSYEESHTITTDAAGVFNLAIGQGSTTSGDFDTLSWGSFQSYLTISLDGTELGITPLNAVPYSIASNKATNMELENLIDVDGIPTMAGQVLKYNGTHWAAATDELGDGSVWDDNAGDITYTSGKVGIGTTDPDTNNNLHIAGDMLIQTNLGDLNLGFRDNGNQWRLSTRGSGTTLQFGSKPDGSNTSTEHFRMLQNGEFNIGNLPTSTDAWMHMKRNSSVAKPHLKLEEIGNDFARLELKNDASTSFWHLAGFPSATTQDARLNFYFSNDNGAANRMTITGDGQVGINGTPNARLHLFQQSQNVGTGLRFDDQTANGPWDITHGFSLRFHYDNVLKGFINANTGAYTQSSDASMKSNIAPLPSVLERTLQLRPATYNYTADTSKTTAIGLIAQEAITVFPEMVTFSEADNKYGVDYAGFSVVAIKAIQEQQKIIKSLEARLAALEAKMN